MNERKVGQFSFQDKGTEVTVSLHEDSLGWPSIVAETEGQTRVYEGGANFEEAMILGLGMESGLKAVKAYRRNEQNS